ncbi:hypothetical protein AYY26_17790 [Photobacterium phosphoreum]|uniref:ABC-three component system protein n=1 Tax=Photobacterium phosphoreum TaxID=659 RepID=UPI0007F95C10|nr:ABC-three component system protein [Photobacterium phosphoreum]OBU44232.1 hypothetical protein AYY26_17790 [Photobacterium phosphoreum]
MSNDFFEQIAADKSQLGFDYQDLVCLEYLIDMRPGETVGLEVFDDVHHERVSGTNALIQVKHSVSDGSALTNRDIDLWKTLYNWSIALDQLGTSDIKFVFFTNKKKTNQIGIVEQIDTDPTNTPALELLITGIKTDIDTKEQAKDAGASKNPIKKHVDYIYELSNSKKTSLFSKIKIIFSADEIFERLAKKIEFFSISESQSLDVVHHLNGVFREQKYKIIKSGEKLSIDYDTFRKKFQFDRIIQISQDRKVDFSRYHQFKNANNIDPKDGIFAKQLSDIDISSEEITEHAIEYAATCMFIQKLIVEGDFSDTENDSINEEVFSSWKSLHRRKYNQFDIDTDIEHKRVARGCFYDIEDISVQVANSTLSRSMVTGKGIELSDMCRIGWRKDWHDLYGEK